MTRGAMSVRQYQMHISKALIELSTSSAVSSILYKQANCNWLKQFTQMHNKSVNRTVKKLRFLPSGYVQR